jgi:16S rRNA (guanine527-N7)-methyltransferase
MLTQEQRTLLLRGAEQLKVELTEEAITRITIYLEELQRWAKIVDLVSQSDPVTIIRKHILDSLAVLPLLPENGHLLDLGSGAGFPGLPIAIARPTLSVSLLEPRRKRVNFLKDVIRKATLTNTQAHEGRAEEFAHSEGWHADFAVVITRATWNIREFLTLATPFIEKDGIVIAMKGAAVAQELSNEETWLQEQGYMTQKIVNYELPFGKEQRSLIFFSQK